MSPRKFSVSGESIISSVHNQDTLKVVKLKQTIETLQLEMQALKLEKQKMQYMMDTP